MDTRHLGFGTKVVHAGSEPDPTTGDHVAPLHLTSTFVFTPERMERFQSGNRDGVFLYTRLCNPTQNQFQEKIAAAEGSEAALATGSGMAAVALALLHYAKSGDHIISARTVYGGTYGLMTTVFDRLNIEVTFVDDMSAASLDRALRPETKAVYLETVLNPTLEVIDVPSVAAWAKSRGLATVVDNTFTTPYLMKPLQYGVDLVIHSTTKYLNGHGDHVGGAIAGSADVIKEIESTTYKVLGPTPSPFACWLAMRGMKTLQIRMERHCKNALALAEWLEKHPKVESVTYPGLRSHPQYDLASRLMPNGAGGMVTFCVKGDLQAAQRALNAMKLAMYAVSLGDCGTLVEQPATMTHGEIPQEERLKMGIKDNAIRVSVGIEDIGDIIADFDQALAAV